MFALILLIALSIFTITYRTKVSDTDAELPQKLSEKLTKLWSIAQESLQNNKLLRAEKALLTILKVDERNATAYNRLGIIYAKQRAYKDAVECFEIAQSLEPSASSLHNVGLIHYETGQYDKALLAFQQALEMDDQHASRHIAYAKVLERMGDTKRATDALEKAVTIDESIQSLRILADLYHRQNDAEKFHATQKRIEKLVSKENTPKHVKQARRVV